MFTRQIRTALAVTCIYFTATSAAPIGYWRFESGALLQDSGPNSLTLTDNNTVGTETLPSGDLPNTVPQTGATNNQAANFNFANSEYFSVADNAAFDALTSGFTIEAFIRPEANLDNKPRTIAAQYSVAGQRSFQFSVSGDTAGGTSSHRNLEITLSDDGSGGSNNQEIQLGGDFQLTNGNDYYVAAGVDVTATNTEIVLYVKDLTNNGPLIASALQTLPFTTINNSNAAFTIGAALDSGGDGDGLFNGIIDEVRLSSGVLGESELLTIPEPGTLTLMVIAMGALAVFRLRRT